jgi:CheY-like chemotaxis protein
MTQKAVVLVVEDEPILRMLAVDVVEEAGFEAIDASDADAAMSLLESRADIRLVFTDIDMPGSMNGLGLAARVHDHWPLIALIVTSGKVRPLGAALPGKAIFIPKPFDLPHVISALQHMAA